ncbi:MATE family efflux transporter [Clostridia bacterium]|nr:MATE family efflux transporter [Clostridia bacterium]
MQQTEPAPQNKMGTAPISKLLLTMGIPMILSMVLQAFYNIVDSYFVSKMPGGENGVNALTLAFPIQMLMIAIGVGTGVGVNALLSRYLGQGDKDKVSKVAGNAIFLGLCTYVFFLIVGLFGVDAYLRSQTTDPVILKMGSEYLGICCTLSFGAILFMIYEKLLQATGRTGLSTIAQVAGAATNIILDPIMIFGLIGCPAMGIVGAAYATVFGQVVSLVLGVIFHHKLNKDVDAAFKTIKPEGKIVKEIYKIGIPAIIMQALMSVMTYGANIILGAVSDAAVTAYGVYYKLQQFVFFAAFGMNNAQIPIVAFNFGKGDKMRVKHGIWYGLAYILVIMLLGGVGFQVFARPLINIFALSDETIRLSISAIRVITPGFLFVGANISFQGIFQAFGYGVHSLMISAIRLIVVALPLLYLFTQIGNGTSIVWWAFPIAEACAFAVAVLMYQKAIVKGKLASL